MNKATGQPSNSKHLLVVLLILGACGLITLVGIFVFSVGAPLLLSAISNSEPNTTLSAVTTQTPTTGYSATQVATGSTPIRCEPVGDTTLSALTISTTDPGIKREFNTKYYKVYGNSVKQVREELNTCGIQDVDGTYDGFTRYMMNYKFDYDYTASGKCKPKNITIGLNTIVVLPEWVKEQENSALEEKWDKFIRLLKAHELEHKGFSDGGAQKVYDKMSTLEEKDTCTQVDGEIADIFNSEIERINRDNSDFDNETDHGRSQGVQFWE